MKTRSRKYLARGKRTTNNNSIVSKLMQPLMRQYLKDRYNFRLKKMQKEMKRRREREFRELCNNSDKSTFILTEKIKTTMLKSYNSFPVTMEFRKPC